MIEIKKGSQILKVSKCTYKDMFEKLGYKIVEENSKEEAKKASSDEIKNTVDDLEKEEKSEEEKNDFNVNIIGEKIKDFGLDVDKKEEKTSFEKLLEEKSNKPKGK